MQILELLNGYLLAYFVTVEKLYKSVESSNVGRVLAWVLTDDVEHYHGRLVVPQRLCVI
jgi:hypothetical protein